MSCKTSDFKFNAWTQWAYVNWTNVSRKPNFICKHDCKKGIFVWTCCEGAQIGISAFPWFVSWHRNANPLFFIKFVQTSTSRGMTTRDNLCSKDEIAFFKFCIWTSKIFSRWLTHFHQLWRLDIASKHFHGWFFNYSWP